eukprot:gene7425-biopygen18045
MARERRRDRVPADPGDSWEPGGTVQARRFLAGQLAGPAGWQADRPDQQGLPEGGHQRDLPRGARRTPRGARRAPRGATLLATAGAHLLGGSESGRGPYAGRTPAASSLPWPCRGGGMENSHSFARFFLAHTADLPRFSYREGGPGSSSRTRCDDVDLSYLHSVASSYAARLLAAAPGNPYLYSLNLTGCTGGKRQRTRTGRGLDAGCMIAFEETDADRTRAWPFLPGEQATLTLQGSSAP